MNPNHVPPSDVSRLINLIREAIEEREAIQKEIDDYNDGPCGETFEEWRNGGQNVTRWNMTNTNGPRYERLLADEAEIAALLKKLTQ